MESPSPPDRLPANIILTGFMGTGKSSVGRALAARLDWPFVDTDTLIEQRAGCTISHLFSTRGEAAFREIEAAVAASLLTLEHHVIATGGGLVLDPANRDTLSRAGRLILLTASAETIWERVRRATHRPLLQKPDPRAELERLLAERDPIYACIPDQVATDGRSVRELAEALYQLVTGE